MTWIDECNKEVERELKADEKQYRARHPILGALRDRADKLQERKASDANLWFKRGFLFACEKLQEMDARK